MKNAILMSVLAFSLPLAGCIASTTPPVLSPEAQLEAQKAEAKARAEEHARTEAALSQALAEMARLDAKGAWSKADCDRLAQRFLGTVPEAGETTNPTENTEKNGARDAEKTMRLAAIFNAGVAHERCGDDKEAKELFERALSEQATFHPAKVHLILMRHRKNGASDLDQAISEMRKAAIVEAQYKNVEGLVALAMLSLERGNSVANADGLNDRARAVRYLQSAMAVDDSYTPAMNGLALYYLQEAQAAAETKSSKKAMSSATVKRTASAQAMELAALVCTQAVRKAPADPVLYNTLGLIQVELGNLGKAAEAFGKARALRPGLYEAEMNFAAVNLEFRGFEKAEEAYRAVLKTRPNDYDARLGLALALRGQISEQNMSTQVAAAQKELEKARSIAPERPEAYYNEAILTQEYKARDAGTEGEKMLSQAISLFQEFIQKADSRGEYTEEVKLAGDRIREIKEIQGFFGSKPQNG